MLLRLVLFREKNALGSENPLGVPSMVLSSRKYPRARGYVRR